MHSLRFPSFDSQSSLLRPRQRRYSFNVEEGHDIFFISFRIVRECMDVAESTVTLVGEALADLPNWRVVIFHIVLLAFFLIVIFFIDIVIFFFIYVFFFIVSWNFGKCNGKRFQNSSTFWCEEALLRCEGLTQKYGTVRNL